MTTTIAVPECPKCGGAMYDNRDSKKNPKSPDFRCKDKSCLDEKGFATALWEKDILKKGIVATPAPSSVKQPLSSGPPLPWETENLLPLEKLDRLFAVYGIIEDHVIATSVPKFTKAQVGASPESVAAQIATLLIAFQRAGQ